MFRKISVKPVPQKLPTGYKVHFEQREAYHVEKRYICAIIV